MTVNTKTPKVLILGAGMAGMSCAQELRARGIPVKVLERSPLPGGRCAHREGFDFGPIFIHGTTEEFLALKKVAPPGELLEGWPQKVLGRGKPCQPSAFQPSSSRWAYKSGMTVLTRHLSQGLDIQQGFQAERILRKGSSWTIISQEGQVEQGDILVLALALEQSKELLATLAPEDLVQLGSPQALLNLFSTVPSLALRARFNRQDLAKAPDWDVLYPEESPGILLISRETSKRSSRVGMEDFVIQARPAWSARRVSEEKDTWAGELLDLARPFLGAVGTPETIFPHRWRYSRLEPGQHLTRNWISPFSRSVPPLAMTGELFHPAGGLEGAYLAGKALAREFSQERNP